MRKKRNAIVRMGIHGVAAMSFIKWYEQTILKKVKREKKSLAHRCWPSA